MDRFDYYNPTRILFGENEIEKLAEQLKGYQRILLAYGGGSIKKNGIYDKVICILQAENKQVIELAGIMPNPRMEKVYEGVKLCKDNNIEFILAVGGGSVIDCSKAIAMGAKTEEDVWEFYYKQRNNATNALPLGTILTLSATGSEMNMGSVITNWQTHEKIGYKAPCLYPVFSILDPTYTYSLPREQTIYGTVDILAHVFETYFSCPTESNLSDHIGEAVIKTVLENLEIALEKPEDYVARSNLMWSSTIALNGITRIGKEEDWKSHTIEHAISAIYDIPHGAGLAIVFPAWMKYVYKEAIPKFKEYAICIWNVKTEGKTDEEIALEGIICTENYFRKIGAPLTLHEMNILNPDIKQIAKTTGINGEGSYKKLYQADVEEILKSVI